MSRPAVRGNIFCDPSGEIVRVTRVTRGGQVLVQVIGGPRDGERRNLRDGVPDDWSQYPDRGQ